MKKTFILLLLLSFLGACSISIKPNHGAKSGGGFCPPGQAKKGNC